MGNDIAVWLLVRGLCVLATNLGIPTRAPNKVNCSYTTGSNQVQQGRSQPIPTLPMNKTLQKQLGLSGIQLGHNRSNLAFLYLTPKDCCFRTWAYPYRPHPKLGSNSLQQGQPIHTRNNCVNLSLTVYKPIE